MIGTRWRKAVRDIAGRPGRSFLAVIAMAAGVFQIGALLYKHALLQPELTTMHGRTRPASATLVLDRVTDALVDSVRRVPGVVAAEARPVILARVRVGDEEWMPAVLRVIRDFDAQQLDTVVPDRGAWPPGDDEVLIERSALRLEKIPGMDRLVVRLAGGEERVLRVAGTVYAAGLAPAWMEHALPGFVSWTSVARREAAETAQIGIRTEHPLDEGSIRETADAVKAMLESRGHAVLRVDVPAPGRHPHADQMDAFLYLLLGFGILSFALSTILVAAMIHALMTEQLKQVGVMKALGATDGQVAGVYLAQVSLLAGAALLIGIPLGLLAGGAYARFAAGILNARITGPTFPVGLVVAEVVAGLAVPVLVALGPVLRSARISVHEALTSDLPGRPFGSRASDRWLTAIPWLSRPLALSLRTTFVRRGRLAITVATLAAGGAVFMAALNVSGAWTRTVDDDFRRRRYDLTVMLAEAHPIERLEERLAAVPGVERAEFWAGGSAYLVGPDGVAGAAVPLIGIDPDSPLLAPRLVAGRWLRPGDGGVVVNRSLRSRLPSLAVGDSVRLRLRGRNVAFPVTGIVTELSPHAAIYAPRATVLAALGSAGDSARTMRVVTERHDDAGQREAARRVERELADHGIEVSGLQRMLDAKQGILDHLVIIQAVLAMAAVIVVVVGGVGMTSTLMLNVIQRTREIGVLGAIGAAPRTIAVHVWIEAVAIGFLSWVLSLALAAPASAALESAAGAIFFRSPLPFYMSPAAAGWWLVLALTLATTCSLFPARHAARLTVREALGAS